jgi:hypothetical protein
MSTGQIPGQQPPHYPPQQQPGWGTYGPPPPKRHRLRKWLKGKQIAGLLAAGAIVLGAAACRSSSAAAPAATTPAAAAPAATTPAAATAASDTQVCNDVNTWESNNDGQAATSFGTDNASMAIVTEASRSSAVDSDVQSLATDSGSSAATDTNSLATDCATAGVTLTGSDFTQAAAAPAATTPAAATAASDTQVCNDVNTWESNNDGQAATSFGTDSASGAIVTEASGSSTVDGDVQSLAADSGSSAATDSLAIDCAAAGVTLTGSDFTQAAATPATAPSTAAPAAVPSTPAPSTPAMSTAEQQAVTAAQNYLDLGSGFSYQSLLNQLTSSYGSGFSTSDAEFAINYLKPDWDAQAVDAAQGYLKIGGFSRSSLIQQLTSSYGNGFTEAQAEYAVSKVGL